MFLFLLFLLLNTLSLSKLARISFPINLTILNDSAKIAQSLSTRIRGDVTGVLEQQFDDDDIKSDYKSGSGSDKDVLELEESVVNTVYYPNNVVNQDKSVFLTSKGAAEQLGDLKGKEGTVGNGTQNELEKGNLKNNQKVVQNLKSQAGGSGSSVVPGGSVLTSVAPKVASVAVAGGSSGKGLTIAAPVIAPAVVPLVTPVASPVAPTTSLVKTPVLTTTTPRTATISTTTPTRTTTPISRAIQSTIQQAVNKAATTVAASVPVITTSKATPVSLPTTPGTSNSNSVPSTSKTTTVVVDSIINLTTKEASDSLNPIIGKTAAAQSTNAIPETSVQANPATKNKVAPVSTSVTTPTLTTIVSPSIQTTSIAQTLLQTKTSTAPVATPTSSSPSSSSKISANTLQKSLSNNQMQLSVPTVSVIEQLTPVKTLTPTQEVYQKSLMSGLELSSV